MTRTSTMWMVSVFMIGTTALLHCGSDDSGSGGAGGAAGGAAGGPIMGDSQCYDCVNAHCSAEVSACYGAGWQTGNFGGECGPFFNCVKQCGTDSACLQGCSQYQTSACSDCLNTMDACISGACPTCNS